MTGGYTRIPCAHADCKSLVVRRAPTGLCSAHYNAKRREGIRSCEDCGTDLNRRKTRTDSPVCFTCRVMRNAHTCSECGSKYSGKRRMNGRCTPCVQKQPKIREQIGEDNLPDYYVLRKRGLTQQQAIDHISAGAPVIRKYGSPRVTITTVQAVRMVGEALAISPDEILSESRFTRTVDCRAVVVTVMHRQGVSDCQIGKRLNRDHTSILHLRRTFEKRVTKRPILGTLVERILEAA